MNKTENIDSQPRYLVILQKDDVKFQGQGESSAMNNECNIMCIDNIRTRSLCDLWIASVAQRNRKKQAFWLRQRTVDIETIPAISETDRIVGFVPSRKRDGAVNF